VVCYTLPGFEPVVAAVQRASGARLPRRGAAAIAAASWGVAIQLAAAEEGPVVGRGGALVVPLDIRKAVRLILRQGDQAFVKAALEAGRPLYRGEGLTEPARVVAQVPDLEDKASSPQAEARWFKALDAALRSQGKPALGEGQLWVGDVAVAASYGPACSMWPIDEQSRCLWLENARLWWPPANPDDAENPGAWMEAQKPSTDIAAGIRSGHEVLVSAPGGYVAVPADLDSELFERLRAGLNVATGSPPSVQ